MDEATSVIATETVFGQRPGGEKFVITIAIGQPFKWGGSSPTEWACQIKLPPLRSKSFSHGEGSLQALCLALRSVHTELSAFVQDGGKLTFENGDEFPLDAYLPPGWSG